MKKSEIVTYGVAMTLVAVLLVVGKPFSRPKEGAGPAGYVNPRDRNTISLSEAQSMVDRAQQMAPSRYPPDLPSEIGTTTPAAAPPTSGWPSGGVYSRGWDGTLAEREVAREAVMDAAAELQQATSAVRFGGDWRRDMPDIESKLADLESALDEAEALGVENTDDLRSKVDRMRSDLDRLGYENWRGVLPDLESEADDAESAAEDLDVGEADVEE